MQMNGLLRNTALLDPASHQQNADVPLVLVVDDNPADNRLTVEAVRQSVRDIAIESCRSGSEAVDSIRSKSLRHSRLPDLILLDLNMPGLGGHEVLSIIKQDPNYAAIPVAILSGSTDEAEVREAYANHANCYIQKPNSMDGYLSCVSACARFWLTVSLSPNVANDRVQDHYWATRD
jgi:two-component system, chemotaxis family, response regulator Rcp1